MTETELKDTWKKWFESKAKGEFDRSIKMRLVGHYYPLARTIANRMAQKNAALTPDELASMGIDGLCDAVQNYDTSFNTKFETYALPRIRGSMLDAIRKGDWVPRLVRSKCTWLDKQRQRLQSESGHRLSNSELAEKLGASEEDFEELLRSTATPAMHSVNDLNEDEEGRVITIEQVEDIGVSQPIDYMLRREFFNKLMGKNFTPQERKIIWLYYFDDRSMKEISESVNLSESRVSQMHSKILTRLRQKAERNPDYFEDVFSLLPKFKGTIAA